MDIIVTAEQMKMAERYMIEELGQPSVVLMEKAAERVFEVACSLCEDIFDEDFLVTVLCGCGNNGGDGMAVARMMHQRGINVCACIIGDEDRSTEEFRLQKKIYVGLGGELSETPEYESDLVIDAMLGIGVKGSVRDELSEIIDELNATHNDIGNVVVSIDIPSGLNADTGVVMGSAVYADYTVCLGCYKAGILLNDGPSHCGQYINYDIGIEPPSECVALRPDYDDIYSLIPRRYEQSNKSTYGKVAIIAGSHGMPGAAVLSTRAALASGVGMVKLLTDESLVPMFADILPEVMVDSYCVGGYYDSDCDYSDVNCEAIDEAIEWCDAILIGPGLGRDSLAEDVFLHVMDCSNKCGKPIVIDADGLYHLSAHMNTLRDRKGISTILTPHPGEFARLFGTEIIEGKHQDIDFLKSLAREYNVTLLAKDYTSIVAADTTYSNAVFINTFGTNALATAGTGDVLAGLTLTMLVNIENAAEACLVSNAIHGLAGILASEDTNDRAVTASDVVCNIPEAINKINVH